MDQVKDIEARRIELGLKKYEVAEEAGIKPEMYSYLMKRGQGGNAMPHDCMTRVLEALDKLEAEKESEKR